MSPGIGEALAPKVDYSEEGDEAVIEYTVALKEGKAGDLTIMDLTVFGGIGGKEAVKAILDLAPNVKVIVVCGYFDDSVMAHYREYGFSGVLIKPYHYL